MSAPINDGGPAFPKDQERGTHGDVIEHAWPGMSLRDYFAGKELSKVSAVVVGGSEESYLRVARHCYAMADAMLKARAS